MSLSCGGLQQGGRLAATQRSYRVLFSEFYSNNWPVLNPVKFIDHRFTSKMQPWIDRKIISACGLDLHRKNES